MKIHNTDCMYYKCIINAALQELEDAIRSANFNGSHVMHGGGGVLVLILWTQKEMLRRSTVQMEGGPLT